ncbi:MAG TPA: RibD family protein [Povalibacter sp.]|nr:RibD family protein [Povalibacter sp.]
MAPRQGIPQGMSILEDSAWGLIRAAAARARSSTPEMGEHFAFDGVALRSTPAFDRNAVLAWENGWRALTSGGDAAERWLDLYLPLAGGRAEVVGQLGQSLDGFIATACGHSHYVTGEPSLLHLHRLRALCDAVVVGAGTVAADDPQLTTRRVSGENPLRVVLDPQLRLSGTSRVFSDGQAPTLRVRACGVPLPDGLRAPGVEDMEVPAAAGRLELPVLLEKLHARGLNVILIEGGGVTVSAFLEAGLLDRLHVAVAPFFIGEGRPGVRLPPVSRLDECHRPLTRTYKLGEDVLFDCDLRAAK